MLKFAILAGTSAIYASVLDQVAASIILWVSALGALSLFMRKWGRPVFRKYMKPQARLSEHMDKMEEGLAELQTQQGAIKGEIGAIKAEVKTLGTKVDHIEKGVEHNQKDLSGIMVSSQAAREDARAAMAVANAVSKKLGIPEEP